jgi:glycosidase
VTLLGGHDDGRFMSEKGATLAGLKLAHAFLLTTRGVPQLYYGDEIAMEGGDEPTTRGDFPGGFPGDSRNAFNAAGRTKDEQQLFEYIRLLISLRRELESLRNGELVNLYVAEQQYAYARKSRSGSVVIVLNNANDAAQMEFDVSGVMSNGKILVDRLGVSRNVTVRDDKVRVALPKRSAAILIEASSTN